MLTDIDLIPIWDTENGRTRNITAESLKKFIDDHPTTDKFVKSGTYSNGNLTLTYNNGSSFVVSGFDVGGSNGYADGGSIGASSDPKTLDTGVYYVTEKFSDSPTLDGSYVGSLIVQDDIDGNDNGKLLTYYTDNGMYYRQKFTGGWEAWKKAGKVELSGFYLNWHWDRETTHPEVGDSITLSVNRPIPPDASLDGMVYSMTSAPDGIGTISGNVITVTGVGTIYPIAVAPNGTKVEGGIDVYAVGQSPDSAPTATKESPESVKTLFADRELLRNLEAETKKLKDKVDNPLTPITPDSSRSNDKAIAELKHRVDVLAQSNITLTNDQLANARQIQELKARVQALENEINHPLTPINPTGAFNPSEIKVKSGASDDWPDGTLDSFHGEDIGTHDQVVTGLDVTPSKVLISVPNDAAQHVSGISLEGGLPSVWESKVCDLGHGLSMTVFRSPYEFNEDHLEFEIVWRS